MLDNAGLVTGKRPRNRWGGDRSVRGGQVTRVRHLAVLSVLAGLGMVGPFSIDTVFPAFTGIERDFAITPVATQQLLSVYLVSFAALSLWHGPISDAVGRRPVVLAGTVAYTLASIGCALAPTFELLLLLRAVQGMSAGAGQIVSRAMVRDLYEGPQAQRVMSHIAMIFAVAPAVAPVVGGLLLLVADWRGIFIALAGYGVLLVIAVAVVLPETNPAQQRSPLRAALVVGSLWSIARSRDGQVLAVALTLTFAGMFAYISSAPLFIFGALGLGERDFWILFTPLIGGMVVGSWLGGRVAHRSSRARICAAGFALSVAGGLGNAVIGTLLALDPTVPRLPWAVLMLPVITAGAALSMPIITLAMLDRFPDQRGAAASVQLFVSLLVNAVVAGAVAPVLGADTRWLAIGALVSTIGGALAWRGYRRGAALAPGTVQR